MSLTALGWSDHFQHAFDTVEDDSLVPARVIRQNKNQYIVHDGDRTLTATMLGRLLYENDDPASLPAVGDWVCIQAFDEDQAIIHAVLPRWGLSFEKNPDTSLAGR